jgi:hypothetical protein
MILFISHVPKTAEIMSTAEALRVMRPEEQDTYYGEMKKITNNKVGKTARPRRKDTEEPPPRLEVMKSRRVRGEEITKQEEEKL